MYYLECLFLLFLVPFSISYHYSLLTVHGNRVSRQSNIDVALNVATLDRVRSIVDPPTQKLQCELIQSAVLNFAPWLEVHHIIVIKDKVGEGAYTLDFSPLNQTSPSTLLKLLFGGSVPGEIRVRYIPQADLSIDEIKNNCMCADLSLSSIGDMINPFEKITVWSDFAVSKSTENC